MAKRRFSRFDTSHFSNHAGTNTQKILLVDDALTIQRTFYGWEQCKVKLNLASKEAARNMMLRKTPIHGMRLMKEDEYNTMKQFLEL